jgi:hypothetical protein
MWVLVLFFQTCATVIYRLDYNIDALMPFAQASWQITIGAIILTTVWALKTRNAQRM